MDTGLAKGTGRRRIDKEPNKLGEKREKILTIASIHLQTSNPIWSSIKGRGGTKL